MDLRDKFVNTLRVAPHGIAAGLVAGGLLLDRVYDFGIYSGSSDPMQFLNSASLIFWGYASCEFVVGGIQKFQKYSRKIEIDEELDSDYVSNEMFWYCDRQALKAAAYKHELGEEFDNINHSLSKEYKRFMWVPEI